MASYLFLILVLIQCPELKEKANSNFSSCGTKHFHPSLPRKLINLCMICSCYGAAHVDLPPKSYPTYPDCIKMYWPILVLSCDQHLLLSPVSVRGCCRAEAGVLPYSKVQLNHVTRPNLKISTWVLVYRVGSWPFLPLELLTASRGLTTQIRLKQGMQ